MNNLTEMHTALDEMITKLDVMLNNLNLSEGHRIDEGLRIDEHHRIDERHILDESLDEVQNGPTIKKKRSDCENNCYELIVAYFYDNQNLQSADELLEYIPVNIQCNELDKYKSNLVHNKKNEYYAYYVSLKEKNSISCENIRNIYLAGKCYKKYPNIVELNKNYNKKQTKGDIYIEYANNQYVAISVKQSKACTDTNYSVYKFFNDKDRVVLINSFDQLLHQNGNRDKKSKRDRDDINKLLYRRDNIYFNQLKLMIEKNKNTIVTELYRDLYCIDLSYDIYKFNKNDFYSIKKHVDVDTLIFEEYTEYYKTKNNKDRKCAKMFYKLIVGSDVYRVEIRWKGNHSASPQFLCYLI